MKAFRRSKDKDSAQKHNSSKSTSSSHKRETSFPLPPKSAIAILPPKRVIRALFDYDPAPLPHTAHPSIRQLPFSKGDFFHVVGRENDTEWYEACNPATGAKGLVPVSFFEGIGKQGEKETLGQRDSIQSSASGDSGRKEAAHDSGYSEKGTTVPEPTNLAPFSIGGPSSSDAASKSAAAVHPDMPGMAIGQPIHNRAPSGTTHKPNAMIYGIVTYDFRAERPDELDARQGEPIIVVAQSNPEWFVAKPIGRLGGPGLIPVSFVSIKDMVTGGQVKDVNEAVRKAGVPRVEEWKRTAAEYKNSSISLGQIGTPQTTNLTNGISHLTVNQRTPTQATQNGSFPPLAQNAFVQRQPQPQMQQTGPPAHLASRQNALQQSPELPYPISASVPRYCFDNDTYWYILECTMSNNTSWSLQRFYADFYDLQVRLIESFPAEAGQIQGKERILPYMPGPVAHVTDAISNGRRQNLDEYIKKIITMPTNISQSELVRRLFTPRPGGGDYELDPEAISREERYSNLSMAPSTRSNAQSQRRSNGSPAPPMPTPGSTRSAGGISNHMNGSNPNINGYPFNSQYSHSNQQLPMPGLPPLHTQASNLTQNSANSNSSSNLARFAQQSMPHSGAQNTTTPSSHAATTIPAFPAPASGAGGSALRIKIEYSSETYAIRVPASINFVDLRHKIADRLKVGEDAMRMRYRDDRKGGLSNLENDRDLSEMIDGGANLRVVVG